MELHDLQPAKGSKKNRRRVGRGTGSGLGKTSGRGHGGAGSRSGWTSRPGREGGQMPLYRRIPKRGFHNIFRTAYQVVNVSELTRCSGEEITKESLKTAGLISKLKEPVKILGNGEIAEALTVKAQAFSKSAKEKIEKAGGKAEVV
jgi:large subunit ribosomal protein L15